MAPFAEVLPDRIEVTILTDRGFADAKLFGFLDDLGFGYAIWFRSNVQVGAANGPTCPADEWVGQSGRARRLREPRSTVGALWEHCGALPGRRGRVCARQGHEGGLVSGGQRRRAVSADHRPLQ
jgi:hypothetical protein